MGGIKCRCGAGRRRSIGLLCFVTLVCASGVHAQTNAQRIGSTHVSGRYFFTDGDFLNEGAIQIARMGSKVIKHYLTGAGGYSFNSNWPASFADQVAIAQHPYFQTFFARPFETFVMTTYSTVSTDGHYWRFGVTPAQYAEERQQFYELALYFLVTYNGTGKTFIFQHWEGDWALRGTTDLNPSFDPTPAQCQGMADWLNARQDGVNLARAARPNSDVKVYHACEVNLVNLAMQGRPTVTNNVVPNTYCDLYSYSAWDTVSFGKTAFRNALNYLASKAPDKAPFGDKNVFSGEYGWPEPQNGLTVLRNATEEGLAWGCPYMIYWQVYDNECSANPTSNDDCGGFWLFRQDGTSSSERDYLVSVIAGQPPGINLARGAIQVATDSNNSAGEAGLKAIDGVIASNSKWTSSGSATPHWLSLDLGRNRTVHTFVVRHAGAGGETNTFNTEQFQLKSATSMAGPWTDEYVVSNATRYSVSSRNYFTNKTLRYVQLYITDPGVDNFARIPEFEVWGDAASPAFTGSPTLGDIPLAVQFTDASTGNIDTHQWNFGDGNTSNAASPLHTYTRPGLYTVTLTLTDTAGPHIETKAGYIRAIGADLDGDGDVDQADFGKFQSCLSGTNITPSELSCIGASMDSDTDVEQNDFQKFLSCMSGPDVPYVPNCWN